MIEDILDVITNIINHFQSRGTQVDSWVLHTVNDNGIHFVQIEGLNHNHTVMFKIRAKQSDLGLIFKYPCIYRGKYACLRKWKLKRMDPNNIRDKSYWDMLKFDDVFEVEYDSFDYSDLKRILLCHDTEQVEIRNNGNRNVYSTVMLRSAVFDGVEDIGLKIIHQDAPLRVNYKYKMFDVYCLLAPKFTEEYHYFLRV